MAVHELFEARRKVGARLSLDIRRKSVGVREELSVVKQGGYSSLILSQERHLSLLGA